MKGLFKKILKIFGLFRLFVHIYDKFNSWRAFRHYYLQLKNKSFDTNHFFFFPFYHIGGAEKVHLDIVRIIKESKSYVFFTLPSAESCFKSDFEEIATCFDLYHIIKHNPKREKKIMGLIQSKINSRKKSVVFSSHSLLFYKYISFFDNHVLCIDLIHAFVHPGEPGAEYWSLPYIKRLDKRVVINEKTYLDLEELYKINNLDKSYFERIELIKNYVDIPSIKPTKELHSPIKVLYVGRNSPEKRIEQIGKLGKKISENGIGYLSMLGPNLKEGVNKEDVSNIHFLGAITNHEELYKSYREHDLVIIMSTREGLPIVIMEAMANGCVVISTDVGGIPFEIVEGVNGYLVSNQLSENDMINEFIKHINKFINPELFNQISDNNFKKAFEQYNHTNFNLKYKLLLNA